MPQLQPATRRGNEVESWSGRFSFQACECWPKQALVLWQVVRSCTPQCTVPLGRGRGSRGVCSMASMLRQHSHYHATCANATQQPQRLHCQRSAQGWQRRTGQVRCNRTCARQDLALACVWATSQSRTVWARASGSLTADAPADSSSEDARYLNLRVAWSCAVLCTCTG